jgi:diguanylate cyclase (GGDEF)-like protein/PAS domain S-box-containing protein
MLITVAVAGVGVLLALLASWRDHNRKIELRASREADSKFLAAAEASLDAFAILESVRNDAGEIIDFSIQYCNANAERLTGKPRAALIGHKLSEVSPIVTGTSLFGKYCHVVNTGEPFTQELRASEANLRVSWVRFQVIRLGDGLAVTCSDISEQREAQERYEHLLEFTDSVFQNAPFSIIAADKVGIITAINAAAEKLTGYSREELVGQAPLTLLYDNEELEAVAASGDPMHRRALSGFEVLTAGASAGDMEEKEWTLIRKDGTRTPINLAMRAVASENGTPSGFVGIAFDVTERRQMLNYVTHLATHDQLTGLLGRALLRDKAIEAVERARRFATKVAVFMIDLDHFKRINDSLGHTSGDHVLIETAQRLQRSVRSTDVVARVGGDEFVVVMPDITSVSDVESCANNLVARLAPDIDIDGQLVNVTASVGVCIYPDFASDAKHLLKRADSAMYAAKDNGRNQHQIFTEDMLKETSDRLSMEHGLRHALANGEMHLHYQPQVSLSTGMITGMEALLRWSHPKLGDVSPSQFIPVAEETGLIVPIGEWAIMTACRECKALQDELGSNLTISINLSPRQFQQGNLVHVIEHALATSGLSARNLEVEITENILMVNSGGNLEKLQKIRELGARISIDDFGTGFCSFSYLLQYHVDRLKIDQSFIKQIGTDPNAAAIVRTIIAMSHGLAMRVVAEGVETDEQFRFLQRRRCDEVQGNFIAGPVPPSEFAAAVRECGVLGVLQSVGL